MGLKKFLQSNKITYRAFAVKVGIDAAQLARYANGSQMPSLRNAYKIFKATKQKVTFESWFKGVKL